jgi:hypothetical protein
MAAPEIKSVYDLGVKASDLVNVRTDEKVKPAEYYYRTFYFLEDVCDVVARWVFEEDIKTEEDSIERAKAKADWSVIWGLAPLRHNREFIYKVRNVYVDEPNHFFFAEVYRVRKAITTGYTEERVLYYNKTGYKRTPLLTNLKQIKPRSADSYYSQTQLNPIGLTTIYDVDSLKAEIDAGNVTEVDTTKGTGGIDMSKPRYLRIIIR